MSFVKYGAEIWRDYVTAGVPGSGAWDPVKADQRAWMGAVEDTLAFVASSLNWIPAGWLTATAYAVGDALNHNSVDYRCILDHTSGASTEPGVGASWATVWTLVGQEEIPTGTAAAPAIVFGIDPDTGFFRGAANALGVSVGGAEIARFLAGGMQIGGSGSKYVGFSSGANALVLDASIGVGLASTASIFANIDANNDDTTRYFAVAKNSGTLGSGVVVFKVDEAGLCELYDNGGGGLERLRIGALDASLGAGNRKLYVQQVDTSAEANDGHSAIECRQDYRPGSNTAANPDGVYGTLWYNAPRDFTGTGAAVRGNAYTISQGGSSVNVTNLVGVYGRGRQEALGTVTNSIAFYADGAQTAAGTTTNAMALYCGAQTAATNNYGVYLANAPNAGSIAAANNVGLTYKVTGTGTQAWHSGGSLRLTLDASGNLAFGGSGAPYLGFSSGQNAVVFDATNGMGINSTSNVTINLDANNDDTTRKFVVAKNSGTIGSGTEVLSVSEAGVLALPLSGSQISLGGGDVLLTHSSNALAFTGGSSGYSFDAPVLASIDDALNTAVTYTARLTHTTSGTPTAGIGVGLELAAECTAGNIIGATIDAITTDVGSGTEDFDLALRTMIAGALADRFRIHSDRIASKNLTIFSEHSSSLAQLATQRTDAHGVASIGAYTFRGKDSAGNNTTYARLLCDATDNTDGSEDGDLSFDTIVGGTLATQAKCSRNATATHTALLVWDNDNATLERVTVGAADSGGAGFKVLRIAN